jgi:hypothetical protein
MWYSFVLKIWKTCICGSKRTLNFALNQAKFDSIINKLANLSYEKAWFSEALFRS